MMNTEFKYLLILDFEAICNEDGQPKPQPQEIIEFPTLLFNLQTKVIESTFRNFVKPQVFPILSEFCTNLTGITQADVDNGEPFPVVFELHKKWLFEHGLIDMDDNMLVPFAYLTYGDWDLKTALLLNTLHFNLAIPNFMKSWINIRNVYKLFTKTTSGSMTKVLTEFGLELEGQLHLGIDDCKNICKIVATMTEKYNIVWNSKYLSTTLRHKIRKNKGEWECDHCHDHNYERNLQCRQCGRDPPPKKVVSNKVEVVKDAKPKKQKKARANRIGDWNCSNCNELNYGRNINCRKCYLLKNHNI